MQFSGRIESGGGGGAYVELPADVLEALGGGYRFRVTGRLNGVDFASSTMAMGGGTACVGIHKATRRAAQVDIGAVVELELERDERPREVVIPPELVAALEANPTAAAAFEQLSFTRRHAYARSVADAKRPSTRARRVQQVLWDLNP